METAQLIDQIKTVLANDTDLVSWCNQTFGRSQMVFVDIDENNPPVPESDYPLLAVMGINEVRGDSLHEIAYELELAAGVVQEEIAEEENTKVFTGFMQVETLRELAENALYRSRISDLTTRGQSNSASYYPLFVSSSIIPIKKLKTNRRGLPG